MPASQPTSNLYAVSAASPRTRGRALGLLLALAAGLMAASALSDAGATTAPTVVCPADEPGCDYTSIQAAIDGAAGGEAIVVRPGTYAERLNVHVPGLAVCAADGTDDVCTDQVGSVTVSGGLSTQPVLRVSAPDVTVSGFKLTNSPVASTLVEVSAGPATFRHNRFTGRLSVAQGSEGVAIDARLNNWGTNVWGNVESLIRPRSGVVHASPFLLSNGSQDPPAPSVSSAGHCGAQSFEPRFIEEAFWCSHPGSTVVLHPSSVPLSGAAYVPAPPFAGNPAGNIVWKNRALTGVDAVGEPVWGAGFDEVPGSGGGEVLDGLTICSGGPKSSTSEPPPPTMDGSCVNNPLDRTVDAGQVAGTPPLDSSLDLRAAVAVRGLTIRYSTDLANRHGVIVRGNDVTIDQSWVVGNFVPAEHGTAPTVNQIGIWARESSARFVVEGNSVRNWRNIGVYLQTSGEDGDVRDNSIRQSRNHGILIEGATSGKRLDIRGNTISEHGFSGIRLGVSDTSNFEIRRNVLALSNQNAVTVQDTVNDAKLDVRGNDWGIYDAALLPTRVDDAGTNNRVLQVPFVDADGSFEPPLVRRFKTPGQSPPDRFFGIQDAVDDPDTTAVSLVNVPKGSRTAWPESVVVGKAGVRVCGQRSNINPCLIGETAADKPVVDGRGLGAPAFVVTAPDVTVEGFLARGQGTGVMVDADRATLSRMDIRVDGGATSTLLGVDTTPDVQDLTVRDNVIRPQGSSLVGEDGVRLYRTKQAVVEGNDIRRFATGVRLRPYGDGNTVRGNTLSLLNTGVVSQSKGTLVEGNTFAEVNTGVDIADVADPGNSVDGHVLVGNDLGPTLTALQLRDVADTHVDARRNYWGSSTRSGVASRIDTGGSGNTVDVSCFLDDDLTTEHCPPTPLIANPAPGAATAADPVPVGGMRAEGGAVVTVTDDDTDVVLASATATGGGQWNATIARDEGEHTITALSTLVTGGVMTRSEPSAPRAFTVDRTPPIPALDLPVDGALVNISTPLLAGTVSTGPGDLLNVTVDVYSGSSAVGTPVRTLNTAADPSTGEWSAAVASPLADGTYTAQAEQSDQAGNAGLSNANTFTVNTALPAVTLDLPSHGSATNVTSPVFSGGSGTAPDDLPDVTLEVYAGSDATGAPLHTVLADGSTGTWSTALPAPLLEGLYTAQAEQSDSASNTGTSSANTFVVDVTPPASGIDFPVAGQRYAASKWAAGCDGPAAVVCGTAADPTSGDVSSGVEGVRFSLKQEASGKFWDGDSFDSDAEVSHDADGTSAWTAVFGFAGFSTEGDYTLSSRARDVAGNEEATASVTFAIDTTAPLVALDAPADGSLTNEVRPVFSGTAGTALGDLEDVTVNVFSGTTAGGSPVLSLSAVRDGTTGAFSLQPEAEQPLGAGTYTALVEQSDDAGNTGSSSANTFTIDTQTPVAVIDFPAAGGAYDQFAWPDGCDPTGFCGTASDPFSGVDRVEFSLQRLGDGLYWNGSAFAGAAEQFHQAGGTTQWQVPFPFSSLSEDSFALVIRAVDTASNVGATASATFSVNVLGPSLILETPGEGVSTNQTRPFFTGTASTHADVGVRIDVHAGETVAGPLVTSVLTTRDASTGAFSQRPTPGQALAEGTYTARAQQFDTATGATGHSNANTFAVDLTAPVVALDPPASPTRNPHPALTGTAGTLPGDGESVTVRVHSGATTSGALVQTLTTTRDPATGAFDAVPAALADGVYTAVARQSDAAGNVGTSTAQTFEIDSFVASPSIAFDDDSGVIRPDEADEVFLSGTSEPGLTVHVSVDDAGSQPEQRRVLGQATVLGDGTFQVGPLDLSGLQNGTLTAEAVAADEYDNVSAPASATTMKAISVNDVLAPTVEFVDCNGVVSDSQVPDDACPADDPAAVGVRVTHRGASSAAQVGLVVTDGQGGSVSVSLGTLALNEPEVVDVDISTFADGPVTATATASFAGDEASGQGFTVLDLSPPATSWTTGDGDVFVSLSVADVSFNNLDLRGASVDTTSDIHGVDVEFHNVRTGETFTLAASLEGAGRDVSWQVSPEHLAMGLWELTARAVDKAGQAETEGDTITILVLGTP